MFWALLIAAAALASTSVAAVQSDENKRAQEEANKTNLQLQELANQSNAESVNLANENNLALAREDRDFQLEMANTAHQREVADLKAAGLNPVLSANSSGAAVVSPNTANQQSSRYGVGSVSPVIKDYSWISDSITSITNLMLVSKLLGGNAFSKGMKNINSASSLNSLIKQFSRG